MRSQSRPHDDYPLDHVVAFDIETLQPPLESGAPDAPTPFQKWPHHRPLVASFLTASAVGGGKWAFSPESVLFEQENLAEAYRRIEDLLPEHGTVCGHNSKGFDAPVLAISAQAARCFLPKLSRLAREPRFGRYHADLAELFTNHRAAQTPSLAELCERLGVPSKLGVDGGDVQSLYEQGRFDLITHYCEQDCAGALLCLWSWSAWKHFDEARLVEPLAAFCSWIQADPQLSHLLPFTTCEMAEWARGRGLVHQLKRASQAATTRLQRDALKRQVREVIHF
jgi:hypothetical protein